MTKTGLFKFAKRFLYIVVIYIFLLQIGLYVLKHTKYGQLSYYSTKFSEDINMSGTIGVFLNKNLLPGVSIKGFKLSKNSHGNRDKQFIIKSNELKLKKIFNNDYFVSADNIDLIIKEDLNKINKVIPDNQKYGLLNLDIKRILQELDLSVHGKFNFSLEAERINLNGKILTKNIKTDIIIQDKKFKINSYNIKEDKLFNFNSIINYGIEKSTLAVTAKAENFSLGEFINVITNAKILNSKQQDVLLLELESTGDDINTLTNNLQGNILIHSNNGSYEKNEYTKQLFYFNKNGQAQYSCLVINTKIKNGMVLINNSIATDTDNLSLALKGKIDLVNGNLQLKLQSTPNNSFNPIDFSLIEMVKISGNLSNPTVSLNIFKVFAAIATGGTSVLVEKAIDKVVSMNESSEVCKTAMSYK